VTRSYLAERILSAQSPDINLQLVDIVFGPTGDPM
jgi:hypothetical protein